MRYLVLSDIHANLAALDAVLKDAQERSYDQVWFLGDLVGYGPDPNECVDRLLALEPLAVAGNHDRAVLNLLSAADFNPDAQSACIWTRHELTPQKTEFLDKLPERQVVGDFTLVHGSPREPIWEYILSLSVAQANFAHFDTPFCLVGHTHAPVIFRYLADDGEHRCEAIIPYEDAIIPFEGERLIINPGSVGQPRDGDPRASYIIIDTETNALEHHRVSYPVQETQRRMESRGLPRRLISRLSFGW